MDLGLADHRMQRPVDPPPGLEQAREKATGPGRVLPDRHRHIPGGRPDRLGAPTYTTSEDSPRLSLLPIHVYLPGGFLY